MDPNSTISRSSSLPAKPLLNGISLASDDGTTLNAGSVAL